MESSASSLPFGSQQQFGQQTQSFAGQIDPNSFTMENYLSLVRQLYTASSTQYDSQAHKQADNLLQQFSKAHQAWSVTMQVLTTPGLDQKEYFNAANILKNKMMYDFASLRQQDPSVSFQMRDNLIQIIKSMAFQENSKPQINSLCTALAILIIHMNESWPDFVEQMTRELSGNVEHATCLLLIIKYMASDCDNDSIVIEDSIRQNYFMYMDNIASKIFDQVFNQWAQKIMSQGLTTVKGTALSQTSSQEEKEAFKMQRLRSKLIDAFYNWIKIRLPDQIFESLPTLYPSLLQLVFAELEVSKDENLEIATLCVNELLSLARKNLKFSQIKQFVISKVEHLIPKVDQAVAQQDDELGEQLQEIFIELGTGNVDQIIETGTMAIPQILLKLMQIPEVRSNIQVSFWRTLFKALEKITNEGVKQQKLQQIEPVLLGLLDQMIIKMRAEDEIFQEFSYNSENSDVFDEIMKIREDFGRVISKVSQACDGGNILQFYLGRLQQAIVNAQQQPDLIRNWASIEAILTIITDICRELKPANLPMLKDVVMLVFQLPQDYGALKRIGVLFLSSVSLLMKGMGAQVQSDVKSFIDYVITTFEHKYLILPGARAFQGLCIDHASILQPYAMEIANKVIPPESADNWQNRREYELILEGVANLTKACEDNQICEALMKRVISPLIVPLNKKIQMLKQQNVKEGRKLRKGEINEATLISIQSYLYLIGHFLKMCQELQNRQQNNPYVKIFEEIWVFIQDIIGEFMHLDDIVEFSIRIVKASLRILGRHFDKYLLPFLQNVVAAYKQNYLASFLYAVEFCLLDYSTHREYESIFQDAFDHLSHHTITKVLTDFRDFEDNPEVAFDFFGLCCRLIKVNKPLFFKSPSLEGILNMWVIGIGMDHQDAIKTHQSFFSLLLSTLNTDLSRVAPIMETEEVIKLDELAKVIQEQYHDIHVNEVAAQKFLLDNGQTIVSRLIEFMLSAPPSDVVDHLVDELVAICVYIPSQFKESWFALALYRIPNNILTAEEKDNHLTYLVQSHKKRDGLMDNFYVIAKRAKNVMGRGH